MTSTLEAHLAGEVTSLCHCWRLTRRDGVVLGFTDHDRSLEFAGTSFSPQTGLTSTEARSAHGFGMDTADVEGALSSLGITEVDIVDGLYDGAEVETFLVNWREPGQNMLVRAATIAELRRADNAFVATLEGPGRGLDIVRGRYVRRGCDAELGDSRCKVNADAFSRARVVENVTAHNALYTSGMADLPSGWFEHGLLTWTSGVRTGVQERVRSDARDGGRAHITLWSELGSSIEAGDAFTIMAGCDKSFSSCRAKFANELNYRGFPHLPGNDDAYAYVSEGGAYDGAPLVP